MIYLSEDVTCVDNFDNVFLWLLLLYVSNTSLDRDEFLSGCVIVFGTYDLPRRPS